MNEHQIIEQSQSREQELHQRKALVNHYRHFPLESQHLEVNINQNLIILNRNTRLKENKVDHQILKDHNQKPQVLDRRPSTKTKHNQLHLHMVLRRTRINHGVIGERSKPKHILLIN